VLAFSLGLILVFGVALGCPIVLGGEALQARPVLMVSVVVGVCLAYVIALVVLILRSNRALQRIREEEGGLAAGRATTGSSSALVAPVEFRTKATFLGWPWIHVRVGGSSSGKPGIAKGWFALGDMAIGGFLAVGGLAVGPVSFGGASLGLLSVGGAAAGVCALGGLGVGLWAVGGVAVGYLATGGCALAWEAAQGGLAVARGFALGGAAFAAHVNDAAAQDFMTHNVFMRIAMKGMRQSWILNLVWLPMLLVIWQAMRLRNRRATLPL